MTNTAEKTEKKAGAINGTGYAGLTRLHHMAYTTYDMGKTRHFYEDVIGMPLTQTWVESREDGDQVRRYVHCLYALSDGGAIAYFEHDGQVEPENRPNSNFHIAFKCDAEAQKGIIDRLTAEGYSDEQIRLTDHGYCVSLYVHDPNGMLVEFTVDHEDVDNILAYQLEVAHDELARWQSGDLAANNSWRPADH